MDNKGGNLRRLQTPFRIRGEIHPRRRKCNEEHSGKAAHYRLQAGTGSLRTNFSVFGPTYNYEKISVMQAYQNQHRNGLLLHIQKFVAQQRAHLGGRKISFNDKPKPKRKTYNW